MSPDNAIFIGNRRELFVDTALIDTLHGDAALRLHHPVPREEALVTDRPWEGNMCGYVTIFQDEDRCRMYYHTGRFNPEGVEFSAGFVIAYAESADGLHWNKPQLGLYEHDGSKQNNIVWQGEGPDQKGVHGFAPFRDPRPDVATDARYKALGAHRSNTSRGLFAMASPDGIHWSLLHEEPVLLGCAFDSQNLGFWDDVRGEYRAYVRDFRDGMRGIRTCTSQDFIHWTDPEWLLASTPGIPKGICRSLKQCLVSAKIWWTVQSIQIAGWFAEPTARWSSGVPVYGVRSTKIRSSAATT